MTEQTEHQMPQPTAEHKLIQSLAGKWKVACKFYMDPSQPPMETAATEIVEKIGEFWTTSKFETTLMGAPFTGCCTFGYEAHNKQFVSTWVDSMAGVLCTLRGTKKGDTLMLDGEFFSCMTNSVLKHRVTDKLISKDEHIFEMFATMPDGKEIKMMTSHYKRA
ncbi:MAG: DUF1579 domain-containing protein [Planctomycetes bacterium]|nr:DUF1579 domain-containing protein [Planctomycetota bacterium]